MSDAVANELPSSSSDVTVQNVCVQNNNFRTSTLSRNSTHPVLATNSYGVGINVTPDVYPTSTLCLQCKQNAGYPIAALRYADDVTQAPFDVLSDKRVECTKCLFVQRKWVFFFSKYVCTVPIRLLVRL